MYCFQSTGADASDSKSSQSRQTHVEIVEDVEGFYVASYYGNSSLSPPHELTDCGVAAQHEENIAACVSGCISPNKQDARNAKILQFMHY